MSTSDDLAWVKALASQSKDKQSFNRAVRKITDQLWYALHPKSPVKKKRGPVALLAQEVWMAADKVLERLTKREYQSLRWKEFIAKVQQEIKKPKTGVLYSEATIRKHLRTHIYLNLRADEIPPGLLDGRQFKMPRGSRDLDALELALYEFKNSLPFATDGYTRFEDYHVPSREWEVDYQARLKKEKAEK